MHLTALATAAGVTLTQRDSVSHNGVGSEQNILHAGHGGHTGASQRRQPRPECAAMAADGDGGSARAARPSQALGRAVRAWLPTVRRSTAPPVDRTAAGTDLVWAVFTPDRRRR